MTQQPIHAICSDGSTACGKRFIGAVPLRLEDVTCVTCKQTALYKAAVLMEEK